MFQVQAFSYDLQGGRFANPYTGVAALRVRKHAAPRLSANLLDAVTCSASFTFSAKPPFSAKLPVSTELTHSTKFAFSTQLTQCNTSINI
jgi:hypothetical protein